jgi:hypothetical protein
MSCATKRIAVLMVNTPGIHKYGHIATYINYKYCSMHGYAFIVERCPRKEDMKKDWMWNNDNEYLIVWSKPALLRRHLSNYDYILIIDSDALFLNQEKRIEDIIHKYIDNSKETCIIAGEDCQTKDNCYSKDALNAGVMLFANKPKTLTIIDHWMKAAENECVDWKYQHTREQMCLQILKDQKYNDNIKIIPHDEINGADGNWIRHYMATSNEDRIAIFNKHFHDFFRDECPSLSPMMTPSCLCPSLVPLKKEENKKNTYMVYILVLLLILFLPILYFILGLKKHKKKNKHYGNALW